MMHVESTETTAKKHADDNNRNETGFGRKVTRGGFNETTKTVDWLPAAIGVIVLLAFLFRLPTLSGRSVWMDEAYSYWFSSLSWWDLWTKTPLYETHPPFYYSLLKIWTMMAGTSEAGMRSLSAVASLMTVAITGYAPRLSGFGKRYDRIGIVASLLLALNQGSIEYAQQARAYALQTLFCTLMILMSVILLQRMLLEKRDKPEIHGARGLYIASGIFAGATLWLHNTSPFIIFGNWLGIFAAISLFSAYKRHDLMLAAKGLLVALLVWSPCIPILLIESRTVAASFWVTISPKMITWPYTLAAGGKFAFVPAIVVAALGWLQLYKTRKPFALYAAAILFIPVLSIFIVSYLFTPIFVVRTFEWMAPVFLFLVAFGLFLPGKMEKIRLAVLAVLVILCVGQDVAYFRSNTQDLRGAVHYLASNYQPGDLVLVYPNELEVGLNYYTRALPTPLEIATVPAKYPAVAMARPYLGSNKGAPAAIESDRGEIARMLSQHRKVWFVGDWSGPDAKLNVVNSELYRERGEPVSSVDFAGTRITLFAEK
ncbi:glycosyltransferase family 39 protein [Paraburkholderia phenazinium]|uniref:Dolichyl-phosphate-mannose-protein mannosyltransferase n=1 Tax=Paraburkholderia phenazinium TaxID=60549 RepID=A0A1G8ET23_9BURK|nr:hypothetical protein [Paraburkholderia phenazinium]SDH72889.1 hypothetical protein SAMN05216466_112217 [Paraburkholderia phenazinium]